MSSIDQRIVDMQFNNKQFESGIKTSVDSLGQLKKGLQLDGAAKGLSSLQSIANSFSLSGMASGIESLNNKFSALGIMGITVLQNITNSAIHAGMSLVKALTIDPIKTGLTEYETKMNAITTIMTNTASKGTTLDQVNGALNELNTYADQTIYNFAEMTRNIGTFTAAGVDLKTSTESIKGIANLAAGSGSSALQASTAMYQLSQAIAGGSVKLMDWNSVVNAGMGGELFQKALEKTAVEMGKGRDMSKSFRESLQDGWITADVLTKTLSKMANDPALTLAATQVKTFTQLIDTMKESVQSGWAQTWENIIGNKDEAAKFFTAINNGFGNIAGASATARNAMLKFWKDNGGRDSLIKGLANAFNDLMKVLKPVTNAFRNIFPATTGDRLVAITMAFERFTARLTISSETAGKIYNTFRGVFAVLDIGKQVVLALAKGLSILIGYLMPVSGSLLGITSSLGQWLVGLDESIKTTGFFTKVIDGVVGALKGLVDILQNGKSKINLDWIKQIKIDLSPLEKVAGVVGGAFKIMSDMISKALGGINYGSVMTLLNGGLFAAILFGIKKLIGSLTGMVDGTNFLGKIKETLDGVRDSLEAYQTSIKAKTLMLIAVAIGILAASLLTISLIDSNKLISSLGAMTVVFGELIGAMVLFDKFSPVSSIVKLNGTMTAMIGLSVAVLILAGAMTVLSKLDWNGIAKGLVGVGVLLGELSIFLNKAAFGARAITTSAGLVILALSLKVLASVMWDFAQMDWAVMGKGLLMIGLLLTEMAIFTNKIGNSKGLIATGSAMLILAVSLKVLASALWDFGKMPLEVIGKGLGVMAVSLGILVLALNKMEGTIKGSAALLVAAIAIKVLASALWDLGKMPIEVIIKGLGALAGVFVVLGIAGLVLTPLVPVILALSWAMMGFGIGILGIAAGLSLLCIALPVFATVFAASSVIIIATAISIITAIAGMIPLIVQKIAEGIVAFCKTLTDSATVIGNTVYTLVTTIMGALVKTIPVVLDAVVQLLTALLNVLVTQTPIIVQKLVDILVGFIEVIAQNAPKLVNAMVDLILSLIWAITQRIPEMVDAGFRMIIGLVDGLTNAINNNKQRLVDSMQSLIEAIVSAGLLAFSDTIGDFKNAGMNVVEGFISGLRAKIQSAANWAGSLASSVLTAAKNVLGIHSPSKAFEELGKYSGEGFIVGLNGYASKVINSATNLGQGAISAMSNAISNIHDAIDTNLDSTPVIRPVLDLTNIQNGSNKLSSLMSGYNLDGTINTTNTISKGIQSHNMELTKSSIAPPTVVSNTGGAVNNTFNITGSNPKEIANEVSRIIQKQIERRDTAWA